MFAAPASTVDLHSGWQIQQGCKISAKGEVISTSTFKPEGWHPATVPGTVVSNLVDDKVEGYPEPYTGMNLRTMPGTDYPIGGQFANIPMPPNSPFRCAWWYRKEFIAPASASGAHSWLKFEGINYRANIWLNGKLIADSKRVAGSFRIYEFNVDKVLEPGKTNVLAVEVFAPEVNDLAITFVDWNPVPPDKNMGLWREVSLVSSGPVTVRNPFVDTKLKNGGESAELTVYTDVKNATDHPVEGTLNIAIEGVKISQTVQLAADESKEVAFTPEKFPQLRLQHPRLWWPAKLGPQNLYAAEFSFTVDNAVSDSQSIKFGVREVTSEFTDKGHRLFKINGKNILIRGGGWTFDMMLRADPKRQEQEVDYALDMNLNTIRLEGKIETDHFLEYADRVGMMIMPGWCCCDIWEKWDEWGPEQKEVAVESLRSQLLRIRSHPSVIMWLNGSDNPPAAAVEQAYLDVEKQVHWPTPIVSSATQQKGPVTGPSGVKMTGPYDYIPPAYWLNDKDKGGAHGFNTETSMGAAIPPAETIRKFIPKDHLWPMDEFWTFHAGGEQFKDLKIYTAAMKQRYGPSSSMEDFAMISQAASYEGERAMFEAFRRNKYTSTGVIQWMQNNAWPSLIWHLYDWYLMPGGGYFGTKKANEPLHVMYSYDDQSIAVVNSLYTPAPKLKVRAEVHNSDMKPIYHNEATVDAGPDSSIRAFTLPKMEGLSPVYFVRLSLSDSAGKTLSDNFYWLSTTPDVMDWDKYEWYFTPTKQMGDFTSLRRLPSVELKTSVSTHAEKGETIAQIHVENPGKTIGFMVRLRVTDADGNDVLPVLFDDNYFPLYPEESRTINARFDTGLLKGTPVVRVEGWNVKPSVAAQAGSTGSRRGAK